MLEFLAGGLCVFVIMCVSVSIYKVTTTNTNIYLILALFLTYDLIEVWVHPCIAAHVYSVF